MVPAVTGRGGAAPAGVSARACALEALGRLGRGAFLRDELHAIFRRTRLPARDRALATQLAAGVVRHRRTLTLLLQHVRGKAGPVSRIQPALRAILELGAFQLLFLDRVPAYAAVNEATESARATARGRRAEKAAGFVNAMLRGLERLVADRDPEGKAAADALPHPEGGVVRLNEAVLPGPEEGRAAFLGAAYSYPDWLVARWVAAFGDRAAQQICHRGNRRPRTFARAGRLGPDPTALLEALAAEAPGVAAGPRPGSLDVSALEAERLETLVREGTLTVQDPSAMAAVEALAPQPGESVLDLCASPGTKTTQIVEAIEDRGRVVACDRSEEKLQPVREVVAARGYGSVRVCLSSEAAQAGPADGFDAALVDVPCSNTGVLARRVEARWRLRPSGFAELARLQAGLLALAAGLVRPGGRLVYSTCTLAGEENEGVISGFLKTQDRWERRGQELILPGADHDGAFWALLARAR